MLNAGVEGRVAPYRRRTAGLAHGDVLEIGGGTGANLAHYPPDANITMLEPDRHMVGRLRRRAEREGRRVEIVRQVGERLPFADGAFDCVVTTLVLCMVGDVGAVVREARRALKPGGLFLFYEHTLSQRARGQWWQRRLNPAWRCVTTGCNLDRDIAGDIRGAGFGSVEMERFDLWVGLPVTIPNIVGVARV